MRLAEIFNDWEDSDFWNSDDKVISLITTHCQPYLQKVGGVRNALVRHPLFRGMKIDIKDNASLINVNQNRSPLDTPLNIHNAIDAWFQKKTGIKFRSSSVFCTGSWGTASAYGFNTFVVIPAGKYDYCWSPIIEDMFEDLGHYVWKLDKIAGRDKDLTTAYLEDHPDKLEAFLQKGKFKLNKGLEEAIHSQHEVMIHCQQAVIVDIKWVTAHEHS